MNNKKVNMFFDNMIDDVDKKREYLLTAELVNDNILKMNTYYDFDNDYMRGKGAYDLIDYKLSDKFYRVYHKDCIELAKEKFSILEDIFENMIPRFDINILKDMGMEFKIYNCDVREINYNYKWEGYKREDDMFYKCFMDIGFDIRIFLRMFSINNEIIINKNCILRFQNKDECNKAFKMIKEHFENIDKIKNASLLSIFDNEVNYIQIYLKILSEVCIKNGYKFSKLEDEHNRITFFRLDNVKNNEYAVDFIYELPTRNSYYNGGKCKSTIFVTKNNRKDKYDYHDGYYKLKSDLKYIIDILK